VGDLRQLMVLVSEMNIRCMMKNQAGHSHSQVFSSALLAAAENGHALVRSEKYN